MASIKSDWDTAWAAIHAKAEEIKGNIQTTISTMMQDAWTTITTKWEEIKTEWNRILDLLRDKVKEIFESPNSVVAKIKKAVDDIANFFEVTLPNAINNFINGALKSLAEKLAGIASAIQAVKDAWDKVKNLGGGGTSTTTGGEKVDKTEKDKQFGGRVQRGRAYVVGEKGWEYFFPGVSGWIANQSQIAKMVSNSMRNIATMPRMSAQPIMSQNILNMNMAIGQVNSPITLAQIESVVTNTIRREFS